MSDNPMKQHGMFSWNELLTSDVNGSKRFYSELFGWNLEDMNTGGMDYTVAKIGDNHVAGIVATPDEFENKPPKWGAYVTVDDVDARIRQAEALGGKIMMPPQDMPGVGRFAVVADPQGATIGIIKYTEQEN